MEPQMYTDQHRYKALTEKIIGCAFAVANELGVGFLEKIYENSLLIELQHAGLRAVQQAPMRVNYRGTSVGIYFADILVEGVVIVELKVVRELNDIHKAQCLNYLKASGLRVALLINFAKPKIEIVRLSL